MERLTELSEDRLEKLVEAANEAPDECIFLLRLVRFRIALEGALVLLSRQVADCVLSKIRGLIDRTCNWSCSVVATIVKLAALAFQAISPIGLVV